VKTKDLMLLDSVHLNEDVELVSSRYPRSAPLLLRYLAVGFSAAASIFSMRSISIDWSA
jgi:hypothetical protein